MRCDVVRRTIEEDIERPAAIETHLGSCPACREYLSHWELLRTGFMALGKEEPPEPSLGFAERLRRRLPEARDSQRGQQFILQAGRRMVYATLLVAVMLILGLVLPSSGPLRTPWAAESVLSQPQLTSMSTEQIMGIDESNSQPAAPAGGSQQRGQEPK
jgi:anti-sigma factor RsiW